MRIGLIIGVIAMAALLVFGASQTLPLGEDTNATANLKSELEATKAELAAQSETMAAQFAAFQAEKDKSATQIAGLEASQEELVAKSEALSAEKEELAAMQSSIETEKQALAAENAKLLEEKSGLSTQLEELASQNTSLTDRNGELVAEIEELSAKAETLTGSTGETAELREAVAALEAGKAALLAEKDDAVATLEATIVEQKTALTKADDQIATLVLELAEQKDAAVDWNEKTSGFQTEVDSLTAQVAALTQTLSQRDGRIAELEEIHANSPEVAVGACQARTDEVLAAARIAFGEGSANISPASIGSLQEISEIAKECGQQDLTLKILGLADVENAELGVARATGVRAFLAGRGVAPDFMRAAIIEASDERADTALPVLLEWEVK